MKPSAIKAVVYLAEPEEIVEGHFWAPSARDYKTEPTDARCPFCAAPMELVSAPVFGRICQEQGKRKSKTETWALIELLPETHEALSCTGEGCEMVLTRVKEGAAA